MPSVKAIAASLDRRVPCALKMDFDNVGLLCGFPDAEVSRVLVALDITDWTIREAEELGAELIVSHHPLIFSPLKRILNDEPEGHRVIRLLRSGISAICMHTNLDIVKGGVNDALAEAIGAVCVEELPCGRVAELPQSESTVEFVKRIEGALHGSGFRFYDSGRSVRRIAICSGSGGELVSECDALGCDTLLTGEIRYHQWLEGRERGLNLVDADHFCTENVVVPVLAKLLSEEHPELDVRISQSHDQTARGV